jgi:hypothetical protein
MQSIQFNHVTTEVTRFEIELTDDILQHLNKQGFDINDPEQSDDIVATVRDYQYDWIEISNDVVDGHFQDGELRL